ncbi:MAG: universal stress protein [Pirellulales bacterium]
MLTSMLLLMEGIEQAGSVIRCGVLLARDSEARLRGLTLVDTREVQHPQDCEAAVYLTTAATRQALAERFHEGARAELSKACLNAKLNFDVRRLMGDPLEVLPQEARFHDLVVTSLGPLDPRLPVDATMRLSAADLMTLLQRGVQPLLVLPPEQEAIERVLLVYDGSEAAGRTIRSYLNLGVLREAECRLLAIGPDESSAQSSLMEMADYCRAKCPKLEMGFAVGRPRRVLVPYAAKWEAHLLVLGVSRSFRLLHRLMGQISLDLLADVKCGLFVQM